MRGQSSIFARKGVDANADAGDDLRRWGHVLAGGQAGAGRGSRSLLSRLKSGCILHDASYHVPLEISASRWHLSNLLLATRSRPPLSAHSCWGGGGMKWHQYGQIQGQNWRCCILDGHTHFSENSFPQAIPACIWPIFAGSCISVLGSLSYHGQRDHQQIDIDLTARLLACHGNLKQFQISWKAVRG